MGRLKQEKTEERSISVKIPEGLFKEFSKKCIDLSKNKNDVIRELIEGWVK